MAKKTLSIVLAVVMLMSVLVVGSFANDSYKTQVDKLILGHGIVNDLDGAQDLDYYLAKDPNIITENLSFWDDEIITAYNNAQTEADWEALYNMMGNEEDDSCWVDSYDGPLTMWYPQHLCNGKAKTDVVYTADKEYVQPGEEITVTISVSTNFYSMNQMVGLIFDKTLMDYVTADYIAAPGRAKMGVVADFGTVSGVNQRAYVWPASMRDNANGEYDQYQFVKVGITYDASYAGYKYAYKYDNEALATVTLKVKDNVADGTALRFFAVDGVNPTIGELELYDEYGGFQTLFCSSRTLSDVVFDSATEVSEFDHTYTFQNAVAYVGEPAPDKADYAALDAAIDDFDDTNAADYKADLWQAYADAKDAGAALSRDLTKAEQGTVDAAADAITNAKAALAKNEVKAAEQNGAATIGSDAKVNVTVDGSPEAIRLTGASALTFTRDDATITENADGTETWAIEVLASDASVNYEVYAKYANWTAAGKALTIKANNGLDLNVYSIEVPDTLYPEGVLNGGTVKAGRHTVIVKTGKDVAKLQFVDTTGKIEEGSTYTYSKYQTTGVPEIVEDGDYLIWTFSHHFGPYGDWSMPVRTRALTTTFATVEGVSLDAYVVY